ncbi:MAG: DedA family protein [Chloroflexi bacterium]|nr:DedA family protein [Chloroflexota bacterium]
MAGIEQAVLAFIEGLYQAIGWPGVLVLSAIESACIPVPSEIILPLAGWMLIKEAGLGPEFLLVAAIVGGLGNTLGSVATYWVGRCGGRRLLERYGRYLLISHHDLEMADRWFAKYGLKAAFFSRLLPVVRTFISLPAGVARTPFWRFTVLTFAGSFIWSGALAYGGYLLGQHWEQLRSAMRPFDIPILIALAALAGWFIFRKTRRNGEHHH